MAFCSHCGNSLDPATKFCSVCGTPVPSEPVVNAEPAQPVYTAPEPVQPVYVAPESVQPVYTAPQAPVYAVPQPTNYYAPVTPAPEPSTKDKVLGFVGMGLGIGGMVFAIMGLLYSLIFMEFDGMGFGYAIIMGMFSFPMSIIGRVFTNKSREAGNQSSACGVGAGMGLAGLIISCVMVFFGFISLGIA